MVIRLGLWPISIVFTGTIHARFVLSIGFIFRNVIQLQHSILSLLSSFLCVFCLVYIVLFVLLVNVIYLTHTPNFFKKKLIK
jgi:hypothetical protein